MNDTSDAVRLDHADVDVVVDLGADDIESDLLILREPTPEVATVLTFIDAINRGDIDGMDALIADQHTSQMFDQPPQVGRESVIEAWGDYLALHPNFKVHATAYAVSRDVAVLGHITGSQLPSESPRARRTMGIWIAHVECRRIVRWRLLHDTPHNRVDYSLRNN